MENIIVFAASYLYLIVIVGAAGVFFLSDTAVKWKLVKLALVVFPLCLLLARILGMVINSPRPFVVDHVIPLIHASSDNGFPSDHTLLAMAVAAIIFVYYRKIGSVFLLLAACVGVARVLAQVHHPLDVFGSTVIAFGVVAFSAQFVVNRFLPQWPYLKQKRPIRDTEPL
jgi:undecaprenyl-diphosphatase